MYVKLLIVKHQILLYGDLKSTFLMELVSSFDNPHIMESSLISLF